MNHLIAVFPSVGPLEILFIVGALFLAGIVPAVAKLSEKFRSPRETVSEDE